MKRTIEVTFRCCNVDVSFRFFSPFLSLVTQMCGHFVFQEFGANEFGIVRGIKHSSRLDDDCQPEAVLLNGGINERFATIGITSQRGCGLDSLVEFFIEQL